MIDTVKGRIPFLSVALTKRTVIVALVVGTALLGAGFGFLPGLLGGSTDGTAVPTTETTSSVAGTQTTSDSPDGGTTTVDSEDRTPPTTATTELPDATGSVASGDEAATTPTATTALTTTTEETDGGTDDGNSNWLGDDESAVDVKAEANVTVASLSASSDPHATRAGAGR